MWRAVYNEYQIKPNGELKSGFFKSKDLSCDIAIFTSTENARRGLHEPRRPETAGLVEFLVDEIRSVSANTTVEHRPLITGECKKHYSHAQLVGKITEGQAQQLKKIVRIVIAPQINFPEQNN
ncbi:MAG: hypothetical protein U1E10_07190 [Bdellovibrionales bacterium]|nr:hypothetical protein [Bdellovibrionales bacterium]